MSDDSEDIADLKAENYRLRDRLGRLEDAMLVQIDRNVKVAHILTSHTDSLDKTIKHVTRLMRLVGFLYERTGVDL